MHLNTWVLDTCDCLCDQACVTFELTYKPPDGSVGHWQRDGYLDNGDFEGRADDERRPLVTDRRSSDVIDSNNSSPKSRRGSRL